MYGLGKLERDLQMSYDNVAIEVKNLTKIYQIYEKPIDRLKQSLTISEKKYYREFSALQGINFTVQKGQTFGIVGQNGSGKSTLLQMLAHTLNPTNGEIKVNGRVAALLELGSGFNPEYTGRENVYLNGSILGVSKEEMDKRFSEIEQFADIGDFIDQPVKTYSSGMYVRLAFAVAINVDADILIVDEALAVGDMIFQMKCYKKIDEFRKEGKTILLVTHDLGSVIKYCDNVLVLNQGQSLGIYPAKDAVDVYKKVVVNLHSPQGEINKKDSYISNQEVWKDFYRLNDAMLEYGNGMADIIDFGIFDGEDNLTNTVTKGSNCKVKMKIRFNQSVESPIFAFTIKDLKGTEITGTNTMVDNFDTGKIEANKIVEIQFDFNMNLQGANYMLALGCTGFDKGEFVVYHRLYDIVAFQVISSKNTVGYFDLNVQIAMSNK